MKNYKHYLLHLLALAGFVLVALFYFSPVLSGKVIQQSDIAQYTGMAQEQINFRSEFKEEPFWTNSAFGGMPTYQLGAQYPHNYIKKLDSVIRFLPRPADYLFIYFLGFYILLVSLRIQPLKAFFGALAFGFSTYLIIILGVGHNAKAHAIAYMPMVLAGVLLVFRKKYRCGGLLTLFAAALEINANHFQMTFYLLLLLLVVAVYYAVIYIKRKDYKGLAMAAAIFAAAGILSLGANATNLMATSEYSQFSTRSNSELTFEPDGQPKASSLAMSYDYITEYSYGIFESLNLFVPRLTGGAKYEDVGSRSNLYQFVSDLGANSAEAADFAKHSPTYWADQPIVAAPAYIGTVVVFLFVLALFVEKRKIKYALLAGVILSLTLSWGKNFPLLTNWFIDYFPMYNKFRAVSSIQVILELCVPVLAVLGFQSFFNQEQAHREKYLKYTFYITGGLLLLLFAFQGSLSFSSMYDANYSSAYGEYGAAYLEALIQDRKSLFRSDVIRSLILIAIAFGALWLFAKGKLKAIWATVIVGLIMVGDLVAVDLNYVNKDHFVPARHMAQPFPITPADTAILADTSQFRVYEVAGGLNSARSSFYHQSLGGYHAAKPRRIQQLFDYQLAAHNNMDVLNMFNVKYVIQQNDQREDVALLNDQANGNAWFVQSVVRVESADQEMKALTDIQTRNTAVFNAKQFSDRAVASKYAVDTTAAIVLQSYQPNHLKYQSNNAQVGLAVFSEVYYPHGWTAYIDGREVPHFAVNYTLRALEIPAGKHIVEFKFEPEVVQTGSRIALISSVLMFLLALAAVGYTWKNNRNKSQDSSEKQM